MAEVSIPYRDDKNFNKKLKLIAYSNKFQSLIGTIKTYYFTTVSNPLQSFNPL